MSDNKLDKLFVEAAEKHEPEFSSANWEKMSALLDNPTVAGTGGSSIVGWKGIASVITLAIVGSVFYYSQRSDINSDSTGLPAAGQSVEIDAMDKENENGANTEGAHQQLVERDPKKSTNGAVVVEIENDDESSIKTTSNNDLSQKTPENQLAQNQINEANRLRVSELNVTSGLIEDGESSRSEIKTKVQSDDSKTVTSDYDVHRLQGNAAGEILTNSASNPDQEANAPEKGLPIVLDEALQPTLDTKAEHRKSEVAGNEVRSATVQSQETSISTSAFNSEDKSYKNVGAIDVQTSPAQSPIVSSESLNREEEALANEGQSEDAKTTQEINDDEDFRAVFPRGFSIKVGASPDFSSVSFKPSSGMGVNVGVLGEYRFANRWSVSAGLITSKKTYSGSGVKYEASNSQVYVADDMEGSCTVMDIPINISYSFGDPARTSYFVTTGLSSYMMMSENYTWSYDNGSQFEVTASNENNDWFKQLNISIGIQRRLSDHFYVQFEPFVKAPLAGVGEGKVSLTSLGAFINVRYSFLK